MENVAIANALQLKVRWIDKKEKRKKFTRKA